MKYMILVYGSQRDYDSMAGQAAEGKPAWSPEEFAALGAFMEGSTRTWPNPANWWTRGGWSPRSTPGESSCATTSRS